MSATLHRMLVLSGLFFLSASGCHHSCLRSGVHVHTQHGGCGGDSCGVENCGQEACGCTAPLYPGDYGNTCRKHSRLRPTQKFAKSMRRSSPEWVFGQTMPVCGECGCSVDGNSGCGGCGASFGYEQNYFQPQSVGCNSSGMAAGDGWYYADQSMMQYAGAGDCGCSNDSQHTPAPIPSQQHSVPNAPRSFQPVPPDQIEAPGVPADPSTRKLPVPPVNNAVPMDPQDFTPMDEPMEVPGGPVPNVFDPLNDGAAPAPDEPIDPVSFEVPQWPTIPDPGSRAGSMPARIPVLQTPTAELSSF